jgi:hypothetical protein
MMRYQWVIVDSTHESVDKLIEKGWMPLGAPFEVPDVTGAGILMQALWLPHPSHKSLDELRARP